MTSILPKAGRCLRHALRWACRRAGAKLNTVIFEVSVSFVPTQTVYGHKHGHLLQMYEGTKTWDFRLILSGQRYGVDVKLVKLLHQRMKLPSISNIIDFHPFLSGGAQSSTAARLFQEKEHLLLGVRVQLTLLNAFLRFRIRQMSAA